jgi:predicted AAA+ superfamily ATPase
MKDLKEKYIGRELETKINKSLQDREIIAILGARQCGKTTLMKHISKKLQNANFISFDDREILQEFNTNIKEFIKKHVESFDYLFIDEFQYAKEGGKQLKDIYDTYGKNKIIISGSSAPELSVQGLKYLVGRVFINYLFPLSFNEFLKFKNEKLYEIYKQKKQSEISIKQINSYYEEFLIYGGYPKVVLEKDTEQKKKIIKNIYNTYLLKEIRDILQISDEDKISKLIKSIALEINGLINYNNLSNLTGFNYSELTKYVDILKKTFIILPIKPFFTNKTKELSKNPKIYFLDSGFRNFTINNFQKIKERTDEGQLNENFIASEIAKKEIAMNYWRTKSKAEVDFVLEKNTKKISLKVKTKIVKPRTGKSLQSFIEKYSSQKAYVLSKDYYNKITIKKTPIFFLPLFKINSILKEISS